MLQRWAFDQEVSTWVVHALIKKSAYGWCTTGINIPDSTLGALQQSYLSALLGRCNSVIRLWPIVQAFYHKHTHIS